MAFIQGIAPIWETKRLPSGKVNANGYILVFDWNTKLPTNVYADPAGKTVLPGGNKILLNESGEPLANSGQIYWDDTKTYELKYYDVDNVFFYKNTHPYVPQSGGGSSTINSFVESPNLFINGQFQIINQFKFFPIPSNEFEIIPGGWYYEKNGNNDQAYIELVKFGPDEISIDASPIRYLRYVSPIIGSGETINDFKYRFKYAKTLAGQQVTVEFTAKSELAGTFPIELFTKQKIDSENSILTSQGLINLTQTYDRYSFTFTIPNLIGESINNPDELEIIFRLPLQQNCDVRMTNFQMNRGGLSDNYDYKSYKQTLSEINGEKFPHQNFWSFINGSFNPDETDQTNYCLQLVNRNGFLYPEWASPIPVGSWIGWDLDGPPSGGYILPQGQWLCKNSLQYRLFKLWGKRNGVPQHNIQFVNYPSAGTVRAKNLIAGSVPAWSAGTTPFTLTQVTGQPTVTYDIQCTDASQIKSGDYMVVAHTGSNQLYALYCIKDNVNIIPSVPNHLNAFFRIFTGWNAQKVAEAIAEALDPFILRMPDYRGYVLRITDAGANVDTLANSRDAHFESDFGDSPRNDNPGSIQSDGIKTHSISFDYDSAHPVQTIGYTGGSLLMSRYEPITYDKTITYNGQSETTVKNIYTNIAYKY